MAENQNIHINKYGPFYKFCQPTKPLLLNEVMISKVNVPTIQLFRSRTGILQFWYGGTYIMLIKI